jgi:tRNA nucleotidyltransferase (CCA-adding enzyme)
LERELGGRVHAHTRFGTAKWLVGKRNGVPIDHLDFTSARTEFYAHPSALPEVEMSSIKQDLRRRDFTINTLAICLAPGRFGQLLDPFGGEQDLERGVIRALHNLSFIEDPTRILRAVRFEQRFGFTIEPRTEQLIGDALDMIARVSGERLRHELDLIFAESKPENALARLNALGVLRAIFPKLEFSSWHAEKFRAARAANDQVEPITFFTLLAYSLTPSAASEFCKRLKFSKADAETVMQVLELRDEIAPQLDAPTLVPSAIYNLLVEHTDLALNVFRLATDDVRARERVELYQGKLSRIAPALTGEDLKKLGVPRGPAYKNLLAQLRNARLDGTISTRAEEEAFVKARR